MWGNRCNGNKFKFVTQELGLKNVPYYTVEEIELDVMETERLTGCEKQELNLKLLMDRTVGIPETVYNALFNAGTRAGNGERYEQTAGTGTNCMTDERQRELVADHMTGIYGTDSGDRLCDQEVVSVNDEGQYEPGTGLVIYDATQEPEMMIVCGTEIPGSGNGGNADHELQPNTVDFDFIAVTQPTDGKI
jgi:hypothetical protein